MFVPILGLWINFEALFLRGKNVPNKDGPPLSGASEWRFGSIALGVIVIGLQFGSPPLLRGVVAQSFNIPSGAQEPAFLVGDYIVVSKYAYGYSRYSSSMVQIPSSGRLFGAQPKAGDVVVSKFPGDSTTDYVKRLIGMPGDRIQVKHSILFINGKPVPRVQLQDYIEHVGQREYHVAQFREILPNGVSYAVLQRDPEADLNNTDVFVVPERHYFVLGDNRDNSADSRTNVGYVPFENFVGKIEVIFFSTDWSARFWEVWKWPLAIRYNQIGQPVY